MLIITTPSRPGQLAESAGHLAGFLQVRHLALTDSSSVHLQSQSDDLDHQALLASPLFLGRVAKRLQGPKTVKVEIYVSKKQECKTARTSKLVIGPRQNSVVLALRC